MHCKACELLIRENVEELGGCTVEALSFKSGILQVRCGDDKLPDIRSVIHEAGYTTTPPTAKSAEEKADAVIGKLARLLVAWVIVWIVIKMDLTKLIPSYEKLTFPIAILVGLVASISTCLAVTWGIVIGYAESVETKKNRLTQLTFHLGRFISFVVGGAILGMIWGQFAGSSRFNGIFSILVWIVLFFLGLQLLGITPNITKSGFHLPGWLSKGIFKLKNPKYAPIVGALTFLLPCGFTQSMQLFALQSGSAVTGMLIMWAFAIGTFPVLFGLWLWTKYIKDKLTLLNPIIASLLVAFGVYTVFNGYTLIHALNAGSIAPWTEIVANNDYETVQISHDGSYFVPDTINLAVGKNYKLVVTPASDWLWCKTAVVIPWVWVQPIIKWKSFEILVDGSSPKTIPLVCAAMWMGMGKIVVQ